MYLRLSAPGPAGLPNHAERSAGAAIRLVAQQRVPEMLRVHADLVRASRLQPPPHQRRGAPGHRLQHLVLARRVPASAQQQAAASRWLPCSAEVITSMVMTWRSPARLETLRLRLSVRRGVVMTCDVAAWHCSSKWLTCSCYHMDGLFIITRQRRTTLGLSPSVLWSSSTRHPFLPCSAAANMELPAYEQPVQGEAQYARVAQGSQRRMRSEGGHALAIPQVPPDIGLHAPRARLGAAQRHTHVLPIDLPCEAAVPRMKHVFAGQRANAPTK